MFFTNPLFVRFVKFGRPGGGYDQYFKKEQFRRLAWNFFGRNRNCYSVGIRRIHKSLMRATINRQEKKKITRDLWDIRIDAASREHDFHGVDLMEGLAQCNIRLDRKVLSDIAIYEPRTFQSLTDVAKYKMEEAQIAPRNLWHRDIRRRF